MDMSSQKQIPTSDPTMEQGTAEPVNEKRKEKKEFRVLICGDRNWGDRKIYPFGWKSQLIAIREWIESLMHSHKNLVIIHGAAKGADSVAGQVATDLGVECLAFPAQWKVYGRAAGPVRNVQMLTEGEPDLVLAFHNNLSESKGTRHMVSIANTAGVPVNVISAGKRMSAEGD